MFQFGRIDTCLFTCKLPLIHSPLVGILLTNRYYPLCRRKTYFLHYPWAVLYPIITLLTAHCHLDNALMNLIFPYLCFRYFLNNYEIWLKRHRPAVFLLTRDVRIFDLINFDRFSRIRNDHENNLWIIRVKNRLFMKKMTDNQDTYFSRAKRMKINNS